MSRRPRALAVAAAGAVARHPRALAAAAARAGETAGWRRVAACLLLAAPLAACKPAGSGFRTDAGAVDAAALFSATCAKCHGESGHADTEAGRAVGAKDLTRPEARHMSDAEIVQQISAGKGRMPAFGSVLAADEIRALVAEVRKRQR